MTTDSNSLAVYPDYASRTAWFLLAIVGILAAGLYWQSLSNALVFDDINLLGGGTLIAEYSSLWPLKIRWLSYSSFVWLNALFPGNWAAQRVVNIALHLATVVAAFWFYRQIFEFLAEQKAGVSDALDRAPTVAFAGAACFALNPVAVYAVAYLVERSIVMATLFSLLALGLLVLAMRRKLFWAYGASGLCYLAAVSSKEHALLLPLSGVLIHFVLQGVNRKLLLRFVAVLAPLLILVIAIVYTKYGFLIGKVFDPRSEQYVAILAAQSPAVSEHPYLLSLVNQSALFFRYMAIWVFPAPSLMSIDMRPGFPLGILSWQLLGVIALLVWIGIGIRLIWRRDSLSAGGLAMLLPLTLFPTEFSTVWIQDPFVLYRSYLWMVFLPLAFWPFVDRVRRLPYGLFLAAFLAYAAWGTHDRIASFATTEKVWTDAVAKLGSPAGRPGSDQVLNNLGEVLLGLGRCKEAIPYFDRAIEINPYAILGPLNRSVCRFSLEDRSGAKEDLELAVARDPRSPVARVNRATIFLMENQLEKAHEDLLVAQSNLGSQAHSLEVPLLVRLAEVAIKQGRSDEAIDLAVRATKVQSNADTLGLLGDLYIGTQAWGKAIEAYSSALQSDHRRQFYFYNRGLAFFNLSRWDDAIADTQDAIRLDPKEARFYALNLDARKMKQDWQGSLQTIDLQISQGLDVPGASNRRATIFAALGRRGDAAKEFAASCKAGYRPACNEISRR